MSLLDLDDCDAAEMADRVRQAIAQDAPVHLSHPFGTVRGGGGWVEASLAPLWAAMPDAERRVDLSITGPDDDGQTWLGQAGHYAGTFAAPFLDIPPTRRLATIRYHEFFKLENGLATEVQVIWDLPDLMIQAGIWPMGPALGASARVPGPATQDGIDPPGDGARAKAIVGDMLAHLQFSVQGPEAMRLPAFWHPRCTWYGPGGIGTARGIAGFRAHHQIPFLVALPDRRALMDQGHFFGQGAYAAFTAWPGMAATVTGGGWLGIAPTGAPITLRSLDFWRIEGDLIRENWVLVDLLHVWQQLGVDVLARMRQLAGRA